MAFDTLSYAKKLQESGVPPRQAEAHAEALKDLADDNLTTKRDLKEVETLLRRDLKDLETALRHEIDLVRRDLRDLETRTDARFRLLYWMLGFNLTLTLFTLSLTAGILLKLLAG